MQRLTSGIDVASAGVFSRPTAICRLLDDNLLPESMPPCSNPYPADPRYILDFAVLTQKSRVFAIRCPLARAIRAISSDGRTNVCTHLQCHQRPQPNCIVRSHCAQWSFQKWSRHPWHCGTSCSIPGSTPGTNDPSSWRKLKIVRKD